MKQNIIRIFSKGEDDCNHEWIYNKPISMSFTTPSTVIQERICECCKRVELVESVTSKINFDEAKFSELKKFSKTV